MKAAQYKKYGGPEVVTVQEVEKPESRAGEVLVRVVNTAITAGDMRVRQARFPRGFDFLARLVYGVRTPRRSVLGSIFSGVVEAVGTDVKNFSVGDAVCGSSGLAMGSHAEYVCVKEAGAIIKKPEAVSHKDAAAILFGGSAALFFIRDKAKVQAGETVLINGAAGAVGSAAVELARYFGAKVTAVATGSQCDAVLTYGADTCVDYQTTDIYKTGTYDVVLDTVGNISPKSGVSLLTTQGRLLLPVASLPEMFSFDKRVLTGTAIEKKEDLEFLLNLVAEGNVRAIIDSEWNLSDIQKAHARAEERGKVGAVVVRVGSV